MSLLIERSNTANVKAYHGSNTSIGTIAPTYYHGTTPAAASEIIKNGFDPIKSKYQNKLYLTTNFQEASKYSKIANNGKIGVVLKIDGSSLDIKNVVSNYSGIIEYTGKISSNNIKKIGMFGEKENTEKKDMDMDSESKKTKVTKKERKSSRTDTGKMSATINPEPVIEAVKGKTAVISWGRMNPVTSGHEKLVNAVVNTARKVSGKPMIFLSHTNDKLKNPLTYEQKIKLAKKAFGNIIVESNTKTIIQVLKMLDSQYDNVIIVVGSDRVMEFDLFVKKYNGIEYNYTSLDVQSAGDRDPNASDVSGMSASKVRAAAASGNFNLFKAGLPTRLQSDAKKVYEMVRTQMGIREGEENVEDIDLELAEELAEVISIQQRIKRRSRMRRFQSKLRAGLRRAKRRGITTKDTERRARRRAMSAIKNRIAGGRAISDLGASERQRIEKMALKRKAAVQRLARRLRVKVRKDHMMRNVQREEHEMFNETVDTNNIGQMLDTFDMIFERFFAEDINEAIHPIMKSSYHKQETLDRLKITAVKKNDPDSGILEDTESKVYRVDVDGKHAGYIWKTSRDSNVMSGAIKIGTSTKRGWVCIRGKYIQGRRIQAEPYTPQSWADPVINILIDHIDKMNKKNEDINESARGQQVKYADNTTHYFTYKSKNITGSKKGEWNETERRFSGQEDEVKKVHDRMSKDTDKYKSVSKIKERDVKEDITEAAKVVWDGKHAELIKSAVTDTIKKWSRGQNDPDVNAIVNYLITQKTFGTRTTNYMMDNIANVSAGLAKSLSAAAKESIVSYSGEGVFSKGGPKKNEPSNQVKRIGRYLSQKTIGPIKR